MTILQPNKNKFRISSVLLILIMATILAAILNIYFYNINVASRYSLSKVNEDLARGQLTNAELKNQLYKLLSFENLNKVVAQFNLVKDPRPAYLESGLSVAAPNSSQP